MPENTRADPRGCLTQTDREYLRGEKEYDRKTSESHRKAAIRDRIQETLYDFSLLLEHLPDDQLQKTLTGETFTAEEDFRVPSQTPIREKSVKAGETARIIDEEAEQGLYDMMLFVLRAAYLETGTMTSRQLEDIHEAATGRFEPEKVVANVDHEMEAWDRDALASVGADHYRRGERPTNAQIRALMETGEVDDEELGEFVRSFVDG